MIKSVNEILSLKEELESQLHTHENLIKMNKDFKEKENKRVARKYFSTVIEENKGEAKVIKNTIDECDKLMGMFSTINTKLLLPFLTECISLIEGKEYVYEIFYLQMNIGLNHYAMTSYPGQFVAIYESQYQQAKNELENQYGPLPYFAIFKQDLLGEKTFKEIYHKETTLLENSKLISSLSDFPYLEQIIYNLIDRRIHEPEKQVETILNEELQSLKEKEAQKKKTYES